MATVTQPSQVRQSSLVPGEAGSTRDEQDVVLMLRLSAEVDATLAMLAARTFLSKADVINMAIGLLRAAAEATDQGKRVGIAGPDTHLDTEFVGL